MMKGGDKTQYFLYFSYLFFYLFSFFRGEGLVMVMVAVMVRGKPRGSCNNRKRGGGGKMAVL